MMKESKWSKAFETWAQKMAISSVGLNYGLKRESGSVYCASPHRKLNVGREKFKNNAIKNYPSAQKDRITEIIKTYNSEAHIKW